MDNSDAHWKKVDIQRAAVGMSLHVLHELGGKPTSSEEYQAALWPYDTESARRSMAKRQSACALLAACVHRLLGVRHVLYDTPYVGRQDAMTRVHRVALEHRAWHGADTMPEPGDVVIIGIDVPKSSPRYATMVAQWGNPGHALICTEVSEEMVKSIDGGRRPVQETTRQVIRRGDQIWLRDQWRTRRIWGIARTSEMRFAEPPRRLCQ
jgi:hypothetical protein